MLNVHTRRSNKLKYIKRLKEYFIDNAKEMKKTDWIILGIIILFYTIISFINLGSLKNPQTFIEFNPQTEAIIEIEGEAKLVSKIRDYSGKETGKYKVLGSIDGENYREITTFEDKYVFQWKDTKVNEELKYIKIVLVNSKHNKGYIGEIQAYDENGEKLQMKAESNKDKLLIDEPDAVPEEISYLNSTYFDEIYFARSGYEYLNGDMAYEWVHPPLGKLIQMIPIGVLGMNPFAYRFMGNIAGILMIGAMYVLGKTIFKDRKCAVFAALLMTFDNFHFAQTRMGTVDSLLVLFIIISAIYMYKYLLLKREDSLRNKLKYLFLSGLFFGLSVSVKWTGLYAGLGLCIMFFGKIIKEWIQEKKFDKQLIPILLSCIVYFIIVPCLIYSLSYFLFPEVNPGGVYNFSDLFDQIRQMYKYHSELVAEHSFTSEWYTWPAMVKPVWLYVNNNLDAGLRSTISGIGNPAIWWVRNCS